MKIKNIAIIDADLIDLKRHRFPNLACMKLSGYYKENGCNPTLITEYNQEDLNGYDKIFLSKVFTQTKVPEWVLRLKNIEYGGTGFYYDKAPNLPEEIEHHMPDYDLYLEWVKRKIRDGENRTKYKYYLDYSIGFTTRGCFRQCAFCVNRNYKGVRVHSSLREFVDNRRKKICLLDDNVLGCNQWKEIFEQLEKQGKKFQFKQGMDARILTPEKCWILFDSNYDGDYIFAFDNVEDYALIESKLKLIRKYTQKVLKFYVFCGFDRNNRWDKEFWQKDLYDLFKRVELLMRYNCLPYIMRFERYRDSPYKGTYINAAAWCNQPKFFKKTSYAEWCRSDNERQNGVSSTWRYYEQILRELPELAVRYFNLKWQNGRRD